MFPLPESLEARKSPISTGLCDSVEFSTLLPPTPIAQFFAVTAHPIAQFFAVTAYPYK